MVTREDLEIVKQKIMETRKAIDTFVQLEKENGEIEKIPVKIVINPKAKLKWMKQAIPVTINEIWKVIKDKDSFEEQQKAICNFVIKAREFYSKTLHVKQIFNGKFIDIK